MHCTQKHNVPPDKCLEKCIKYTLKLNLYGGTK